MRGVPDLKGLRDSRTLHSTAKRSIPVRADSAYLDLYMLQKEKERLERERSLLDKRKEAIQKRLNEIGKQMEELQEIAQKEEEQATSRGVIRNGTIEKKWKAMPLSY